MNKQVNQEVEKAMEVKKTQSPENKVELYAKA
jgi:hypothetical protein